VVELPRIALLSLVLALLLPGIARAQAIALDKLTPALPTQAERNVANVISTATVLTSIALDARASWQSEDRLLAFTLQGVRLGAVAGFTSIAKTTFHRSRPCAPDCGAEQPEASFYSGHTAFAFSALGGPSVRFSLTLAASTGGLRVAAGKHWLTDTLVGAAVGAAASRIR
jgi:membrane-associated phospholipid phosphatase